LSSHFPGRTHGLQAFERCMGDVAHFESVRGRNRETYADQDMNKRKKAVQLTVQGILAVMENVQRFAHETRDGRKKDQRGFIPERILERYLNKYLGRETVVELIPAYQGQCQLSTVYRVLREAMGAGQRILNAFEAENKASTTSFLGAPRRLYSKRTDAEVVTFLKGIRLPCYASISRRYKPTADAFGPKGNARQVSLTDSTDIRSCAHAVLIDRLSADGNHVIYKDPNFGNTEFKVTLRQFRDMGMEVKKGTAQNSYMNLFPGEAKENRLLDREW